MQKNNIHITEDTNLNQYIATLTLETINPIIFSPCIFEIIFQIIKNDGIEDFRIFDEENELKSFTTTFKVFYLFKHFCKDFNVSKKYLFMDVGFSNIPDSGKIRIEMKRINDISKFDINITKEIHVPMHNISIEINDDDACDADFQQQQQQIKMKKNIKVIIQMNDNENELNDEGEDEYPVFLKSFIKSLLSQLFMKVKQYIEKMNNNITTT